MQERRLLKSAIDKVQFGKEYFCSTIKGESHFLEFYLDKTRARNK
jgi:hypothetical protein